MADTTEAKKRVAEEDESEISTENGNKRRRTLSGEANAEVVELEEELSPEAGVMIVCGGTNWDMIGRKELPKAAKAPPSGVSVSDLMVPHAWRENVRVRYLASSSGSCHSVLITEDGKAYSWGRNESGQLGLGDTETRYKPTLVEELSELNIVQAATGKSHTLFLTDNGGVYSCGSNKMGQLGQGSAGKDKLTPAEIQHKGKPTVRMACGADFSMIVDIAGGLFSFGSPEYGQLGHNTDGKSLERANKFTFQCENSPRLITRYVEKDKGKVTPLSNVCISDVKCGTNHTVAVDTKGRVFTWGFGGYGRLGHAETKDEMAPRLVKILENFNVQATKIAAGSSFCLASGNKKMIYFWGQTKSSGEATMYPKPVHDLSGWNVRSVACHHKGVAVAAEDSMICWGPSPTYGELCFGDTMRSSTTPKEVKAMEGLYVKEVSCGYGHTLMLVRDLSPEERQRIAKLPKWP